MLTELFFPQIAFSFVLNDILTHQRNVHVNISIWNSRHFCLESCGRFTSQKLKILWANNWLANFYTFLMIHTVPKHTDHGLNCIIFVYTSALERQALCKGVRHWLSLVLTLALPFVIKTSTISAYPIKAAACKGDLFSESRLLTASGSFSRISSTSSMLPAIMACTRGGWKIQKVLLLFGEIPFLFSLWFSPPISRVSSWSSLVTRQVPILFFYQLEQDLRSSKNRNRKKSSLLHGGGGELTAKLSNKPRFFQQDFRLQQ